MYREDKIQITTKEQYYDIVKQFKGKYDPLVGIAGFEIEHKLRLELQEEIFGKGNKQENNQKFYHWVWEHKPHYCYNCSKPLPEYSAKFISHRFSRGAHPEMAYDPRNADIMCQRCHERFEHKTTRVTMAKCDRIEREMKRLKEEYKND